MRQSRPTSRSGILERLARIVIRFRWAVVVAWLAIVVVSGMAAAGLPDLFKSAISLPGTDSQRADDILQREFGQKALGSFTLVARDADSSALDLVPAVQAAAERAAAE